jgi:tetratricopeptide (TPR) repeat protein/predicted Ser/Thr protein kinase
MNARVEELFHAMSDLPPDQRERYYAEHEVDAEIRHEVEVLLAFDTGASDFILRDIGIAAGRALPLLESHAMEENPGRCGPYRLIKLIGRGGMGAVYLAERADGEVTQKVAIKLLPPGAGNPQRERFLQERQILASLAHPNIARMVDAGHLEHGQPFLAMEFVDGQPIDAFCAGFTVRQRIGLFLKVCAAVSYLHRNLVVHRDLKPSNILVTADGEPKLLDFGIAKILDLATDATVTSMRMLTPDYASPEQVMGGSMSTATDIYSLGAVLYRLLTGKPLHEFEQTSAEGVALAITRREATRPSKWEPALKGDLDLILLKAVRKDPQDRYATVEQFAEDLQAFIESRPVRARPAGAWYRARKFVRRNRVAVAAAALAVISLSTALYEANRQRIVAEQRFLQLRSLAQELFNLDRAINTLPGSTAARQHVVATSLRYLDGLAASAGNDLDLAREIAEGYWRVGRIQGVPVSLNLGDRAKAEASLKKANDLIERVLETRPHNHASLLVGAAVAADRMILAQEEHRNGDAVSFARTATARTETLIHERDLQQRELESLAGGLTNIAQAYINMHMYDEAIPLARQAVETPATTGGARARVAQGKSLLANALRYQGDLEGALKTIRQAREIVDQASLEPTVLPVDRYGILLREGMILGEAGSVNLNRPAEAVAVLQLAFDMSEETASRDPNDATSRSHVCTAGRHLANILVDSDPERALSLYDKGLSRLAEVRDNIRVRRDRAVLLASSSYALRHLHRTAEARQRIDAAFELLKQTRDYPSEAVALEGVAYTALMARADFDAEQQRDPQLAVAEYEQLLEKVNAARPEILADLRVAPRISSIYGSLARAYRRAGQTFKAEAMDAKRLDLWRHWDRKLPGNAFVQRQLAAKPT